MPDFNPATLTATVRRIHDLRMAGWRPTEIAREVSWSRENVKSRCERLKRRGAEFPPLKPADLDRQIEAVVACKRRGMSIRAIVAETGIPEGRVSYFAKLARRRGMDVPFVPGGGLCEGAGVVVSGTGRHGYPRRVIAVDEAEARAWWAVSGGTIERVEILK